MPPTIYPTGTTIYNPQKAHNCYVLYDGKNGRSYLIDMNGNLVHEWPFIGFPVEMIDPEINNGEKGQILCQKEPQIYHCETLLIADWDANIVFEWGEKAPGGKARQNHDMAPLPNGNILVIVDTACDIPENAEKQFDDQAIYEITRDGDIVWEWFSSEHIEELGFTGEKKDFIFSKKTMHRRTIFNLNDMAPLGPNKWFNQGDDRFHPDNIMIDSRQGNFIAIIEKKTGNIVWQMGPDYPGSYDYSKTDFSGDVPRPVDSIIGQHDAHMIPEGLPGAGNVLVFDNHGTAGFPPAWVEIFWGSRILEIDPISKDIIWQYDASVSNLARWSFMSYFISSARRLPNGNTLIDEGMHGRIFQVTPEGEIVWEYVNPYFGYYVSSIIGTNSTNYIYRAQPIPYDWVPDGTPRTENAVITPDIKEYRV